MQSNLYEPSQLPDLPGAGFFTHWLLEAPLAPAALLIALGLVVFIALRHTNHAKKIGIPALGLGVILGGGVYLLGSLVVTDREVLVQRATELVEATSSGDTGVLSSMLDPGVRVRSIFASVSGRQSVINLMKNRAPGVVANAQTRRVNAGLSGPQVATTQIKVRVKGEMLPSLSWWSVNWTRPSTDSDDWVVTHIEPIWIQGFADPVGIAD